MNKFRYEVKYFFLNVCFELILKVLTELAPLISRRSLSNRTLVRELLNNIRHA